MRMHCLDTIEPSPFAHEILNARPYAFLDDAPLEERRTRAVSLRHSLPDDARDLAKLDAAAIAQRARGGRARRPRRGRAARAALRPGASRARRTCPASRPRSTRCSPRAARPGSRAPMRRASSRSRSSASVRALFPARALEPAAGAARRAGERSRATRRARSTPPSAATSRSLGPVTAAELATRIGVAELPGRGGARAARGARRRACAAASSRSCGAEQFCDRSLLARIHRYTLARLRREIEPVSARVFLRFLLELAAPRRRHASSRARAGCSSAIERLSGLRGRGGAPGRTELLPARVDGYKPALLDSLCLSGAAAWGRISPARARAGHAAVAADADRCLPARRARRAAAERGPPTRWRSLRAARPRRARARSPARARCAVRARDRGRHPPACRCRSRKVCASSSRRGW